MERRWGEKTEQSPFASGTYEEGDKPPIPCLRASKALDPKSPGCKYFLPQ